MEQGTEEEWVVEWKERGVRVLALAITNSVILDNLFYLSSPYMAAEIGLISWGEDEMN